MLIAPQALLDATRTDAEEMLCFLRWLDHDCDGYITESDFVHAVMRGQQEAANGDAKSEISDKWHAASLVLERVRRDRALQASS